jgi:YVTN family beta-propeller protein
LSNVPTIVDANTKQVIGTIDSAVNTFDMAVSPDQATAYFTDVFDTSVLVVDLKTNVTRHTIRMPEAPWYVAVSPSGDRVYALGSTFLYAIDARTNSISGRVRPPGLGFCVVPAPDGRTVFVCGSGAVWLADSKANTIAGTIVVGGGDVTSLAVAPDGSRLYALSVDYANNASGSLSTVDVAAKSVLNNVPVVGAYPVRVALAAARNRAYVTFQGPSDAFAGTVLCVDLTLNSVIASVALPGYGGVVAVTPAGDEAYVYVSEADGYSLMSLSTATNTVTARITGFWNLANGIAIVPPKPVLNYEAEAPNNVLTGKAAAVACAACSGGAAVAGIGEPGGSLFGGTLTFRDVASVQSDSTITIYYSVPSGQSTYGVLAVNGSLKPLSLPVLAANPTALQSIQLKATLARTGNAISIVGFPGMAPPFTIDRITVQ